MKRKGRGRNVLSLFTQWPYKQTYDTKPLPVIAAQPTMSAPSAPAGREATALPKQRNNRLEEQAMGLCYGDG
jgi:hypothetical protein